MKCRYSESDIALFVEGDLDAAKAVQLEAHLVVCAMCRGIAAEVRDSQAALKSLRQEMVSSAALMFVRNRVLEEVSQARVRPVWGRWVWALAGAMFVVLVSVGVVLHSGGKAKTPLLGEGGGAAPSSNIPLPLKGADGVVRPSNSVEIGRTTPSAPTKVASRHFLGGRSHPSFSKEGSFSEPTPSAPPKELVVKLLTDDPNIVIYWLVDEKNGGTL